MSKIIKKKLAPTKEVKLYSVEWYKKHPNHFIKNPHKKQVAARDRHLNPTGNKDGYTSTES